MGVHVDGTLTNDVCEAVDPEPDILRKVEEVGLALLGCTGPGQYVVIGGVYIFPTLQTVMLVLLLLFRSSPSSPTRSSSVSLPLSSHPYWRRHEYLQQFQPCPRLPGRHTDSGVGSVRRLKYQDISSWSKSLDDFGKRLKGIEIAILTLLPILLEPARVTCHVLFLLVTLLLLSTKELVEELKLGRDSGGENGPEPDV